MMAGSSTSILNLPSWLFTRTAAAKRDAWLALSIRPPTFDAGGAWDMTPVSLNCSPRSSRSLRCQRNRVREVLDTRRLLGSGSNGHCREFEVRRIVQHEPRL